MGGHKHNICLKKTHQKRLYLSNKHLKYIIFLEKENAYYSGRPRTVLAGQGGQEPPIALPLDTYSVCHRFELTKRVAYF